MINIDELLEFIDELVKVNDDACINFELCEKDDGTSRCVASFSLGQLRVLKMRIDDTDFM